MQKNHAPHVVIKINKNATFFTQMKKGQIVRSLGANRAQGLESYVSLTGWLGFHVS